MRSELYAQYEPRPPQQAVLRSWHASHDAHLAAAETQALSKFFAEAERDGTAELSELVYLEDVTPKSGGKAFTRLIKDLLVRAH